MGIEDGSDECQSQLSPFLLIESQALESRDHVHTAMEDPHMSFSNLNVQGESNKGKWKGKFFNPPLFDPKENPIIEVTCFDDFDSRPTSAVGSAQPHQMP